MKVTEVKICGLVRAEDALASLDYGADYLGFVLYPKSPRALTGIQLARLRDKLPVNAKCVGVFVNTSRRDVERVAADCGLHAVQIHGDEDAREFEEFALPVWRALQIHAGACAPEPAEWPAQRYVVDAAPAGVYGGSGVMVDWAVAKRVADERRVMLAGGLTPDNVGEAVCAVRPAGVDVSSGVEARPGVKDLMKVRRFIECAGLINERDCE